MWKSKLEWRGSMRCSVHRDAELAGLRADLAAKAADAQLLVDLQSQLATRETEIARLQGELSSKV